MGLHPSRGAVRRGRAATARVPFSRLGAVAASIGLVVALSAAAPASAGAPSIASAPASIQPSAPTTVLAADSDYPSWSQVAAAKHNASKVRSLISQIEKQITQLEKDAQAAQADAQQKGELYEQAQEAYDTQNYMTQQLEQQASDAQKTADDAKRTAGQLLQMLGHAGDFDVTAALIAQAGTADSLLYRLGTAQQLGERSEEIYTEAVQAQNTASSLQDQAQVATDKLDALKQPLQDAFNAAQAAAKTAQDKLDAQQNHENELKAQEAALKGNYQKVYNAYIKGIKAKWGPHASGHISADGWALPASGWISSGFGMRYHPVFHEWLLHSGTDIAAAQGSPIYAAHQGTVTYAGWYGNGGNAIIIDNGGGISTAYEHIMNGGILVHIGQSVGPGQQIAKVGMTGDATGPHLHFEVRINGSPTDPVPFMKKHGITLG